jgi:ribosomal protein S18 acetylase RimI-like enzyme
MHCGICVADLRIGPITTADLEQLARVHRSAFPDGAITALGAEAVRRYYAWLLEGPHDAMLNGAWLGDRLVGFCAAGVFRGAMNGFLRKNRIYLALHLLAHPALLLTPLVRDRVRTALQITYRFSRFKRQVTQAPLASPAFGVLAIATADDARGVGAGRALMQEAERRARAAQHTRMVLTVHPDNVRAVRFYERLGWSRRNETSGTWVGLMEKVLE